MTNYRKLEPLIKALHDADFVVETWKAGRSDYVCVLSPGDTSMSYRGDGTTLIAAIKRAYEIWEDTTRVE